MSEELLSLKWNNHQSHFVDILTFLREQEIFIDVTLACGGKLYPAHKFVLSTCSDYFKQMFTKNPNKHPIVFMKDVSCRDLEALLDFMYNGEVNVPQSCLGSLIKTAEGLQIKGLAVPDDPPSNLPSKRESVSSSIRDRKSSMVRDNSYSSPSPKRLRAREKSPPVSQFTSNSTPFASSARSSHSPSQIGVGDEDSRTSAHSEHSSPNNNNNNSSSSKPNVNNSHFPNDDGAAATAAVAAAAAAAGLLLPESLNRDPSPGPSGLHKPQSKEEELEIKQEDVVDLGENEETDWRGLEDSGKEEAVDEGGGGDPLTSENNPNFADVLGPSSDGALNTSGDPAMSAKGSERSLFGIGFGDFLCETEVYMREEDDSVTPSAMPSTFSRTNVSTATAVATSQPLLSTGHCQQHFLENEIPPPQQQQQGGRGASCSSDANPLRRHLCELCWKSFKRRDHLVEHLRTHTGEKPYGCRMCHKRFAKKSNLNAHARSHFFQQNPQLFSNFSSPSSSTS